MSWIDQLSSQAKQLITSGTQTAGKVGNWMDNLSDSARSLISNIKKTEILKPEGRELFRKAGILERPVKQFPVAKKDITGIAGEQYTPIGREPRLSLGEAYKVPTIKSMAGFEETSPEMKKMAQEVKNEAIQNMAGGFMTGLKQVGIKGLKRGIQPLI